MKTNIISLIQDDIKISRLIGLLENLAISANSYYLGNFTVIFSLMEITDSEENRESYHCLVEQGEDLDKYGSPEKVKELAEEIYRELLVSFK
jgi:hypothetical protein